MDNAAFIFWILATIALIDFGLINMGGALARKGYNPRLGLFLGPILGLVLSFLTVLVLFPLFFLFLDGAQAVLGAAFDRENDILDVSWDSGGTRAIVWTENETVSIYTLSQINDPVRMEHQEGELEHVAWGPDQQRLLTWGSGSTIELWTTTDSVAPQYIMEHDSNVVGAIWNNDAQSPMVLTWTENNTVYVWTPVQNLDVPSVLPSPDTLISATWSRDQEKVLLWYADDSVRIWDITDIGASNRLSVSTDSIERNPFLALRVIDRSPASRAGLRTGDMLIRIGSQGFNLDEILLESDMDRDASITDIRSAISNGLVTRVNIAVNAALADFEAEVSDRTVDVEVYRAGEFRTVSVSIPTLLSAAGAQRANDLGFTINYVSQNPVVIPVGQISSELNDSPWSPNRDLIMSWSLDNSVKVYPVNAPDSFIALPYQEPVLGALWGDNSQLIILWTEDESFAWNLEDNNAAFRSKIAGSTEQQEGFILSGAAFEAAGMQAGDVLVSINGQAIDTQALITEFAADATTTRQINRVLPPLVQEQLFQAATAAMVNGQTMFGVEVYRAGELIALEVSLPTTAPELYSDAVLPNLFPALSIPFLTTAEFDLTAQFINENPRILPIDGRIVDIAADNENDFAAVLTNENVMYIWNLQVDTDIIRLEGVSDAIWNVDGSYLVTWQDGSDEAIVWSAEDIGNPRTVTSSSPIMSGSWNFAGDIFVLLGSGDTATVWNLDDLEAPASVLEHDGNIVGAKWAPTAQRNSLLVHLDNGMFNAWLFDDDVERGAELNERISVADDLSFDISFSNVLPSFDASGARSRNLEFARVLATGVLTFIGGYLLFTAIFRLLPSRTDNEELSLGQRDMKANTVARQLRGRILQTHYLIAIIFGMVALSALLWNITKGIFTVTAISQTTDPLTLTDGRPLGELNDDELARLIVANTEPRLVRTAIRDYVWGVTDRIASAQGEGLTPIYETTLGDSLPDGIRFDEDITYAQLREDDHVDVIVELMAYNTDKETLDRLAVLTGLSRRDLARELIDALGPEGVRDFIVSQNVWPTINADPDAPYDPQVLQTELNLANRPDEGITFNTLPDYPNLLVESLAATGPSDVVSRTALEDAVFTSEAELNTSRLPTINLGGGVEKAAPSSILNRLVAQAIADNVLAEGTTAQLREIFRKYTWQISTEEANTFRDEPILEVSELRATPLVPEDLDFVYLPFDPQAMGYILRDNLNIIDLETIAIDLVVRPFVVKTWTLDFLIQRELFNDNSIDEELVGINAARAAEAEQNNSVWNDATIEYRSWLNLNFLRRTLNANAELSGMRNAILGTLWMISITISVAFPIGIGAAIYLEEYAGDSLIKRIIQTNIDNLAGVPSIIYGLLGVALFVRALEPITSGTAFGYGDTLTANGRTILSAALTMALLILPIIIINAQEAIRAVQPSIRQASFGLGATKWQTVWNHVLPYAMPGILTGTILAMSRAIGETAPLVVVGAATFIVQDPDGPFSKFTALPMQIYFWTSQPRDADKAVAAAAIAVLMTILISLNSFAIILRNRFEKQVRGI